MSTLAVIPVKRFGRALRRLAGVLTRPERASLQAAMLTDLLCACRDCRVLDGTVVVTSDPDAASLARRHGAAVLPDHDPPQGMNAAVRIGQDHAAAHGYDAALVLTADLPLTRPHDLAQVITAAPAPPGAVLVPSRHGTGTNALLLTPPAVIGTRLGPDSRARHRRRITDAGLVLVEQDLPWIGLDIDTPEDLALLLAAPAATTARAACLQMGIERRLATEAWS